MQAIEGRDDKTVVSHRNAILNWDILSQWFVKMQIVVILVMIDIYDIFTVMSVSHGTGLFDRVYAS